MAKIQIGYDVTGIYYHEVDTDDYLWDDESPKWEDMTDEEKEDFVREVSSDVFWEAERDSDYPLGSLCSWEDENCNTHDINY